MENKKTLKELFGESEFCDLGIIKQYFIDNLINESHEGKKIKVWEATIFANKNLSNLKDRVKYEEINNLLQNKSIIKYYKSIKENEKKGKEKEKYLKQLFDKIEKNSTLKVVCVGDHKVKRTELLLTYEKDEYPKENSCNIFDQFTKKVSIDGKELQVGIWDTATHEDYDKLRPLSYPETDVIILVFSVDSPLSLQNIKNKWIIEIRTHLPHTNVILAGINVDMRDDHDTIEKLKLKDSKPTTQEEGIEVAKEISAVDYIEVSAKTNLNVKKLFEGAVRSLFSSGSKDEKNCVLF